MSSPPSEAADLGQYLVERGLISPQEYRLARNMSEQMEEDFRYALLTSDFISQDELNQALAEKWGLQYIRLADAEVDYSAAQQIPRDYAIEKQVAPYRHEGGTLWVAVTKDPDPSVTEVLADTYEFEQLEYVLVSVWDMDGFFSEAYRDHIRHDAYMAHWMQAPEESAYTILTNGQFAGLLGGVLGIGVSIYYWPEGTLIWANVLISLLFLLGVAFKLWVGVNGGLEAEPPEEPEDWAEKVPPEECPSYTILVPLYREANVVKGLIASLLRLNYPKSKLEVLLLLEEDDEETMAAVEKLNLPSYVRHIIVPAGQPQTKPRACNVGLQFARGDQIVIYDAEDRPEPNQLRKVVAAFEEADEDIICFQCALNYYNKDENFLTKLFTLEYTFWYDYMVPGLQSKDFPIPLGGTSNHFRTAALRRLGGWDPFNVTEDADLGIRAGMRGWRVGVLLSTTYEEANKALGNWIRQRSRWIKGYIQTALVHSRHPKQLIEAVGWRRTAGFLLLVGGTPVTMLLAPVLWGIFVIWFLTDTQVLVPYFPPPILYIPLLALVWGNMMGIYLNLLSLFRRGYEDLAGYALLNPAYWVLQSIGAYKAVGQLVYRPFYWEKTTHGLTSYEITQ